MYSNIGKFLIFAYINSLIDRYIMILAGDCRVIIFAKTIMIVINQGNTNYNLQSRNSQRQFSC